MRGTYTSWTIGTGVLLLSGGTLYLGYGVDRVNSASIVSAFSVAFLGYALLIRRPTRSALTGLLAVGVCLRFLLAFAFPLLSDDLYRFLWDGYLIVDGQNPFTQLPAYYLEEGNAVAGLTPALFDRLNSPDFYTIYPPVAQGVFSLAVWLFPDSWYGAAVVMKLFLCVCELGSLLVLWRLSDDTTRGTNAAPFINRHRILYYWLNPLVLVEICGNIHFEGAMVFCVLLSYYWLRRSAWIRAGLAMAAGVASKLLPLLLLPYLIRRLWGRPFWVFSAAIGTGLLVLFGPLLLAPGFVNGFQNSLALYQQKFEFNASLYYLGRAVGFWQVGWNVIATLGPFLAKLSAVGILSLALLDGRKDWTSLAEGWLFAFVLYLLCATTVHPWYLSVPIVLCVFTRWRFPLVWSYLITLTYASYATVPYAENLWLVGLEYTGVLGWFIWEWRTKTRAQNPTIQPT